MIKKLLLAVLCCLAVSLVVTKSLAADTAQKLNTYLITWTLEQSSKMTAIKVFSGMTVADDAALDKKYGLHTVGRWHSLSDGSGFAVVEAASVEAIYASTTNWVPFMSLKVTPVLNDADTRKVFSAYFSEQDTKK